MMNNNNNNDNDNNRIELIGLNEFIQDDKDNIELDWGVDEDERPFPDSDEAIRALQDIAESVDELEAECYRLRAELKTSNAERDEARREVSELKANEANRLSSAVRLKGWICFEEETQ